MWLRYLYVQIFKPNNHYILSRLSVIKICMTSQAVQKFEQSDRIIKKIFCLNYITP